jgi:hypothetical protein
MNPSRMRGDQPRCRDDTEQAAVTDPQFKSELHEGLLAQTR